MNNKRESGAIMLEGMIVTVITLFVLIWLLGLGFLYYQKYVVRIVTNDAATKVADTYYNPTSDIIMGYVDTTDISNSAVYNTSSLESVNQQRAEAYILYMLNKTNFAGVVDNVVVTMEFTNDSVLGRTHVTLTTQCTFNTPFGDWLDYFGMSGVTTYETTAYAESTNISSYVSRVNLADFLTSNKLTEGTGVVDKVVKMINSFIKFGAHYFS